MKFTSTVIDLYKLPRDSHLWKQLVGLTVKGWRAEMEFRFIRNKRYKNGSFKIKIVYHEGVPIAWGLRACFNERTLHPNLWLYTSPEYRNKGIQKKYILSYWNKKNEKFAIWSETIQQKKAFNYLKNKIDVSKMIPVDLSV